MTPTPVFPNIIDSTMLTCFRSCPEKFYNEFCLNLAPAAISPDLHAGGAFAAGIEAVRRAFYADGLALEAALAKGIEAFTRYWGDYTPPEKHAKTYTNMSNALFDYFERYDPKTDHVQPLMNNGQPQVECRFAHPMPVNHPVTKEPLIFAGRFDMLGAMAGQHFIVDEKTTKGFAINWSRQWSLRSQFLGYTWACREQGINVEGAIIRGIAILKSEFRHLEAIIPMPQWQLDRWYLQTVRDMERMVACWDEGFFDFNYGESCSSYGGCQFEILCTAKDPALWYGDFTTRNWNPLHRDPVVAKEEDTDGR